MTLAWYDRGMMIRCVQCDGSFEATGRRGPTPRYCSSACRKRASRARGRDGSGPVIPEGMRALRRWVRCDARKRPVDASGRPMSWTRPGSWLPFWAASSSSVGAGLGFVLGDGVGCIDLDDCISSSGELSDLASRVVASNPGAYVEVSQSGRGLHVFGLLDGVSIKKPGYEVYSGEARRFVWVTGDVFRPGGLPKLVV